MSAVITASGTSSEMDMVSSGVALLLAVPIPPHAAPGQSYTLNVLYPTGTSDGVQNAVTLAGMTPQTLTIGSPSFLVGDPPRPTATMPEILAMASSTTAT